MSKWELVESVDGAIFIAETGNNEAFAAVFPLGEMRTNPHADLIVAAPELLFALRRAVVRQGFTDAQLISARELLKNLEKIY